MNDAFDANGKYIPLSQRNKRREEVIKQQEVVTEGLTDVPFFNPTVCDGLYRDMHLFNRTGCPHVPMQDDGPDLINSSLNGILFIIGHGGVKIPFNLTVPYVIPYRMLTIFSTLQNFSGKSHVNTGDLSHRMQKLLSLINAYKNCLHEVINSPRYSCDTITAANFLRKMHEDTNAEEATKIDYLITFGITKEIAEAVGRILDNVGASNFGTTINQRYSFSNFHWYNDPEVHDAFSGLFIPVFCKIIDGDGRILWYSTNYEPIIFSGNPTKISNARQPKQNGHPSILDALVNEPAFDISSMRDIKKVLNMGRYLNLVIKILIVRGACFISANSQIKRKNNSSLGGAASVVKYSIIKKLDYGLMQTDLPLNDEDFLINGLPIDDDNIKIASINSEDVSVLMHILWLISNGKDGEMQVIENYMKSMYYYYYHLTYNLPFPVNPDRKAEIEPTLTTPIAAITIFNTCMNNYIHELSILFKISFLTVNKMCRPPNNPEDTNKLVPIGDVSQEFKDAMDTDFALPATPATASAFAPPAPPASASPPASAPPASAPPASASAFAPPASASASASAATLKKADEPPVVEEPLKLTQSLTKEEFQRLYEQYVGLDNQYIKNKKVTLINRGGVSIIQEMELIENIHPKIISEIIAEIQENPQYAKPDITQKQMKYIFDITRLDPAILQFILEIQSLNYTQKNFEKDFSQLPNISDIPNSPDIPKIRYNNDLLRFFNAAVSTVSRAVRGYHYKYLFDDLPENQRIINILPFTHQTVSNIDALGKHEEFIGDDNYTNEIVKQKSDILNLYKIQIEQEQPEEKTAEDQARRTRKELKQIDTDGAREELKQIEQIRQEQLREKQLQQASFTPLPDDVVFTNVSTVKSNKRGLNSNGLNLKNNKNPRSQSNLGGRKKTCKKRKTHKKKKRTTRRKRTICKKRITRRITRRI